MKFACLNELARLAYFELKGGQLYLKDGILPDGAIDMHAHLGWHYLFTRPIDFWSTPKVRHFFPQDIPITIERYTAYDFTTEAKKTCEREVVRGAVNSRGFSATHTIPNILAEMDRLGIAQSVILAIDYPVLSRNSVEQLDAVCRAPFAKKRLPVYISLHPMQPHKEQLLKEYLKKGARGIKLHPQMQLFRPSDKSASVIYHLASTYGAPVLFHTGLSPISPRWQGRYVQRKDYEDVFFRFPKTTFIIGHAGGVDGYEWAAEMANRYPHVYVETSGQPPRGIEYLIRHMDADRILYGSDWPFYPMALPLAKTLLATEKYKKMRPRIFWKNAQKLLHLD